MTASRDLVKLGPEFEVRQEPEHDGAWQDSVVLAWWDLANGIGGFHRIGHQPFDPGGPCIDLSNNIFTADRVFKRSESLPLREGDLLPSGGFGCGDGTVAFEFTDHPVWTFAGDPVAGELHLADFHTPVDIYPKKGQLAERITAGHLEAGARVTGELEFAGTKYDIDGLAFRDRGWGKRHWGDFLAHRWVAASFGPEATVLAVSVLGSNNEIADFGCVIRGDEVTHARELDIVTYLERDGLTHRGGHVSMVLTDGERVEMEAEVLQKGAVSWMAGRLAVTDTMCRIAWGDRVGICDFEITNNASQGTTKPGFAINGFVEDGLHG